MSAVKNTFVAYMLLAFGTTGLLQAADQEEQPLSCLEWMLSGFAASSVPSPAQISEQQKTAFFEACNVWDFNAMELMLAECPALSTVRHKYSTGSVCTVFSQTAAEAARRIRVGDAAELDRFYAFLRLLKEKGADTEVYDPFGRLTVLAKVICALADGEAGNSVDGGSTLFSECYNAERLEASERLVRFLLEMGARPEHPSVLRVAAREPIGAWMVALLLVCGAQATSVEDDSKDTPLHALSSYTSYSSHPQMCAKAKLLCSVGADVNARNYQQQTPLMCATRHCDAELARTLLALNADVNACSEQGTTVLHCAVDNFCTHSSLRQKSSNILRLLIENNAQVNAANNKGQTPLHVAVRDRKEAAVSLLLSFNADPMQQDGAGKKPIELLPVSCDDNVGDYCVKPGRSSRVEAGDAIRQLLSDVENRMTS